MKIEELVTLAGENSRDHGFHDDWPSSNGDRAHGLSITEKLCLIHEEISEALGEIRSGHFPGEVYYSENGKPEGFGIELADAMIRIADLAYLTRLDLPSLIAEKHQYNITRPAKHGRRF